MKLALKIIFIILSTIFIILSGILIWLNAITYSYSLNKDNLVNLDRTITYYDTFGNEICQESNGLKVTEFNEIPSHTINAFIAIEDKRFYSHNGIDYKRMLGAMLNNVKSFSFKEGASTITQQLIKNTHLTNEKTIKRKVIEIKLAKELERQYTKDEIIEKYLNTIYFGNNCYGITSASKKYFNKSVSELNINESATLAATVKAPSYYSPLQNFEKSNARKNVVLKKMLEQNFITQKEYNENVNKQVILSENDLLPSTYDALSYVKKQVDFIKEQTPYFSKNVYIYTTINTNFQSIIENELSNFQNTIDLSVILLDKNSNLLAYHSTCPEENRQLGSTIKPLIAYGPAIENDLVSSFTKINDEKVNYNGYSPSNYNDKYYGKVTVKESLEKSLNTCAVKLLNYTGIEKAKFYVNKTDLRLTENDNSLCIALGASENGSKLSEITSAYSVFLNKGNYTSLSAINKVKFDNFNYLNQRKKTQRVFSDSTISILNDMLHGVISNGTARKLSNLNGYFYGKTGTVGNENGNTDAYLISYTKDYILGCWCGAKNGELMSNDITGASLPSTIASKVWEKIYQNLKSPSKIPISSDVQEISIDKIDYDNNDLIVLSDNISPERYKKDVLIKKSLIPKEKSKRFSSPKIEKPILSVNNEGILIELCQTEYYGIIINRYENGNKIELFNLLKENCAKYLDTNVKANTKYVYSAIPYYKSPSGEVYYGKEVFSDKIKTPSTALGDEWWNNEYD